jgi:hypothetical protein
MFVVTELAKQYLLLKEQLMEENIGHVTVAGFVHRDCVMNVHNLVVGNTTDWKWRIKKSKYQQAATKLGWEEERFKQVYNHKMSAEIDRELVGFDV